MLGGHISNVNMLVQHVLVRYGSQGTKDHHKPVISMHLTFAHTASRSPREAFGNYLAAYYGPQIEAVGPLRIASEPFQGRGMLKNHVWNARFAAITLAGLASCGFLIPAHAQDPTDVSAAEVAEPAVDPEALYSEAMLAEWDGRYDDARRLHLQAAELNVPRAHYQLGFLLLDGLGGPRDGEQARFHLRRAADLGVTLALVPYIYAYDDQDDPDLPPDARIAAHALLELSLRDLATAGDTIQFWSQPMRRQVQVFLKEAGFYRGAIDGLIGQGSLNALRAFSRRRGTLPELPERGFERIILTQEGVTADNRPTFAWSQIDDLVSARSAFAGAWIDRLRDDRWRIGVEDSALIDWPAPGSAGSNEPVLIFDLPRASADAEPTWIIRFGMGPQDAQRGTLGACAIRIEPDYRGYAKRCETRVAGVHLVFEARHNPAGLVDAPVFEHMRPPAERLKAIELTPPVQLRLAGADSGEDAP